MNKVSSWKELSLREKIGQTVICLCESDKHIEMCGSIEKFLEKYPVGGIFNNGGIVKGLLTGANPDIKNIVKKYNEHLRVPLFLAADHGSFVDELNLEMLPQMALGATNDEKLAYEAGVFKAEDAKKTGIHWLFWPVCDLNVSKCSPVTDVRSVSDKADLTSKIVKAEVKAMKDCGVIATLKHYPGPAYDESIDPHLTPIDNETPMDLWMNTYGKMYKELFDEGVPSIMIGHFNLVNYQTETVDGEFPPATLSYELTTKLLREELGFKGVTVTDALCMGGFSGANAVENTVKCFLSGNDVLLWPCYEYIDEMEKRILSGEIDESVLDKAVERIWNLKKEYGILDEKPVYSDANEELFVDTVKKISEKSLTLVNNDNNLIPINKNTVKNVYIVGVTPDDDEYKALCLLKEEFISCGCNVVMKRNAWTDEIEKAGKENDLIIFALSRTMHRPIGPLDFWGEEATSIWASNCSDKKKTLIVSFGSPYLYRYYKKSKMAYVNAYSSTPYMIKSFVKAVFGEIEFEGKSSVELI